jgi:tight adherence protein B
MTPSLWLMFAVLAIGPAAFALALTSSRATTLAATGGPWGRYRTWVGGELRALGHGMSVRAFFGRHVAITVGLLGLGLLITTPAKALLMMLAGALGPVVWFKRMHARRQQLLNEQLDPGLQLMANAVLATQNLLDGFDALARHGTPPLSIEAELLVKEVRIGASIEEAMLNLIQRCRNRNVDTVVTALAIGRRTGGNLPKVLELIARVLRETMRVEGIMASKTSEGKASGWVMSGLPVFFMIVMSALDPEWMAPLYDDVIGNVILGAVIALTIGGAMLIRKVSTIDV